MKKYPISNIYIDYDGIQCECYLSKNRIKKAAYNCIYGALVSKCSTAIQLILLKTGVLFI